MLRALFWSVLKIRKKCLFDIFHFTSKFTKSENKRMLKLFGSCLSKAVRYIFLKLPSDVLRRLPQPLGGGGGGGYRSFKFN